MSDRKREVKRAMFLELNDYWQGLSEARITRSIHPIWEERRLPSFMAKRYTHTVMHRLALGRGPLRAVVHRRRDEKLQMCRFGCDKKENAFHMIMGCHKTKAKRELIKKQCQKMKEEFNVKTLFTNIAIQDDLENLIGEFLNA